jgi:hypothetical protein
MRKIKSKAKGVIVRRLQGALAFCLIVSAGALGLLATSGAANKSVGIDPRETLGQQSNTALANAGITRNTVEVLSYQDSKYRFAIIAPDETPPPGWEQPDFVPAGFSVGNAAFGSGGECPLQAKVQTNWPIDTQLLVRRLVSIPAGASNVRIMVSVDNDIVGVFFNGTLLPPPPGLSYPFGIDTCPVVDQFRFDVPPELVQQGDNRVVYQLKDRGIESFFDTRILAEVTHDDFSELIGRLRRAVGSIAERVPTPAMTNIRVTCDIAAPTPSTVQVQKTITFNVNTTGHAGRIEITVPNLPSTDTTTTGFIDNTPIFTCTRSTRAQACERSDTPVNVDDVTAITAVVGQPVVQQQLSECMVNAISSLPASNPMARNVKSQQPTSDEGCPSCQEAREFATFDCDDLAYNCHATCVPQVLDPEHPIGPWCEWCDDKVAECQGDADQALLNCNRGECIP